jgi:hypothetical protein
VHACVRVCERERKYVCDCFFFPCLCLCAFVNVFVAFFKKNSCVPVHFLYVDVHTHV